MIIEVPIEERRRNYSEMPKMTTKNSVFRVGQSWIPLIRKKRANL